MDEGGKKWLKQKENEREKWMRREVGDDDDDCKQNLGLPRQGLTLPIQSVTTQLLPVSPTSRS